MLEKEACMYDIDTRQGKPTVIVTGSSGLLGTAVIKALAAQYRLIGFDRAGPPHPPPEARCVSVDVTQPDSIHRGLEDVYSTSGARIASVIHLAAYYDFSGKPSPLYQEVTVRGTERLLRALKDFQVEQFLFSSTMLVHQPTEPGRPINEETPLDGLWAYPQSKIETERRIIECHGDIPVVLLRIAGVYTDTCDSIPLAHQIQRLYEKRLTSRVYPGDTSHGQAFVHLDDVVEAVTRAVNRRHQLPHEVALLIGEPETYSYEQIQSALAFRLHDQADWSTQQIPKALAKMGIWIQDKIPGIEDPFIQPWMVDMADAHYELDISRAQGLLEWRPRHRLLATLPHMVDALQADPIGWYARHKLEVPSTMDA
jgi:nucleoside-diphosphate-sugar epimerase